MIVIVWEFRVRAATRQDFERAYGPDGDWVRLFRGAPGYDKTELLRDAADELRYLTLDRWRAATDFDQFRREFASEYDAIDRRCAGFTASEKHLGTFEVL